jgi:hypothetical protein
MTKLTFIAETFPTNVPIMQPHISTTCLHLRLPIDHKHLISHIIIVTTEVITLITFNNKHLKACEQ